MKVLKKKSLICTGVLMSSLVLAGGAFAQNGGEAGSAPNPFSDCGIGAAIFKNNVAAVISNVIWDIGTTAVTSALSSPETCEGDSVAAAEFIYDTYAVLEEQVASGSGTHLAAVFDILQCDVSEQQGLASDVRTDFSVLVSKEGYSSMTSLQQSEQFFNIVQSHTQGVCGVS